MSQSSNKQSGNQKSNGTKKKSTTPAGTSVNSETLESDFRKSQQEVADHIRADEQFKQDLQDTQIKTNTMMRRLQKREANKKSSS